MQKPVVGSHEGKEERAVPGLTDLGNVCKHICRYNYALLHCQGKTVIDAACGSGYGSFLLGMVAQAVTGADISPEAVQYAREKFDAPHIDYRVQDVTTLDQGADVIVSFETVEHLDNLAAFEAMALRCLVPGGLLIYSVPLNETKGFNPYHKHLFNFESARSAFPNFVRLEEAIQHGINFYPPNALPLHLPWLAYLGVYQRR